MEQEVNYCPTDANLFPSAATQDAARPHKSIRIDLLPAQFVL